MAKGKRKVDSDNESAPLDNKKKKQDGGEEREDKLLAYMMQSLMRGVESISFRTCASSIGFMERTKTMRTAWQTLLEKGFIEPSTAGASVYTSDHKLTKAGKEHASTPEYIEYLKDMSFVPTTNVEHQERIKKKLINKHGIHIFDLLLEHGSLTRMELAGIIGVNDRSHSFSYALKQLKKDLKHVEDNPNASKKGKLRLADKAFLPDQRPDFQTTSPEDIAKLVGETEKTKAVKKEGAAKKHVKNKPVAPKSEEKTTQKKNH